MYIQFEDNKQALESEMAEMLPLSDHDFSFFF